MSRYATALDFAEHDRRTFVRPRTPVQFGDLSGHEPVSHRFGTDRGTPIDCYYIPSSSHRPTPCRIAGDVMEIGGSRYAKAFGRGVRRVSVLHVTGEDE